MDANVKTRGYKKWCKDNGYTETEMQQFFDDIVAEGGSVLIDYAVKKGCNWYNLALHQIAQLPGGAERLRNQKKAKADEKAKEEMIKKQKEDAEIHYYEHMNEILVNKIDNGECLSEKELQDFKLYCGEDIQKIEGSKHRWQQEMTLIKNINGRFFALEWMQGLTECQYSSYNEQPYEVEDHPKTIIVHEWKRK